VARSHASEAEHYAASLQKGRTIALESALHLKNADPSSHGEDDARTGVGYDQYGPCEVASYSEAWRVYGWWSRAYRIAFFAYLPAMVLSDRIVRRTFGDVANTTTLFVALAWMIAFAVIGYQKTNFSCPRCGEMFFRAWDDRPSRKD